MIPEENTGITPCGDFTFKCTVVLCGVLSAFCFALVFKSKSHHSQADLTLVLPSTGLAVDAATPSSECDVCVCVGGEG